MRKFTIDLSEKDFSKRMRPLIKNKWFMNSVERLSKESYLYITENSSAIHNIISNVVLFIVNILKRITLINNQCILEIDELTRNNSNIKNLFISNLSYELSKIYCDYSCSLQWCSSSAKYIKNEGYIHGRNMDWPLDGLIDSTIIINYKNSNCGDFSSVGFPGFSGVITGVAKGRFSASVNMMIEDYGYKFSGKPIAMLLREVFETCKDFKSALNMILESDVMSPAFIHLVGVNKGENCVIGVMTKEYDNFIHNGKNKLSITNHIPNSGFRDKKFDVDSVYRLKSLNKGLGLVYNESDMKSIMSEYPVHNDETKHTVIMNPKTGYLHVE